MKNKIIDKITLGKNILLIGEKGIGKTYFLNSIKNTFSDFIYAKASSTKVLLVNICKQLGVDYKSKTIPELAELIYNMCINRTFLIDDIHKLDKNGKEIINEIIEKQGIILAASSENVKIKFDEVIKFKRPDSKKAHLIAKNHLKLHLVLEDIPREFYVRVLQESRNNPGEILRYCRLAVNYYEKGKLDFDNDRSISGFFRETEYKKPLKLPNILTVLTVSAYIFLIFRYAFYRIKMFEMGYTLAILGYMTFAMTRAIRYSK